MKMEVKDFSRGERVFDSLRNKDMIKERITAGPGAVQGGAAARVPGGFLGRGDLVDLCDAARGQGSLLGARYVDRAGRRLRGGVARARRAGEDGVGAMVTQGRDAPGRGEADSFLICDQNCVIVGGRGTGSSREGLWDGGV